MKPWVLAYPGNESVAAALSRALAAELVQFELRHFPDRESFLRIDSEVQSRPVVLVCTLSDPDSKLLPLIFLSDTLRELGATSVGLVAPYLAYMRQDCRFHAGEALTSASFARLLSRHFDWLVTVDPHLHRYSSLGDIYTVPAVHVEAAPLLSEWIRANVEKPLLIGPDAESEQWVNAVAAAVPCPKIVLQKLRKGDRDVEISTAGDIQCWAGHTPVLVDDIVSTARTLIEAIKQSLHAGLRAPLCLAVHGLFVADAWQSLQQAGAAAVVTTNTITHPSNSIDVVPLLTESVSRLLGTR